MFDCVDEMAAHTTLQLASLRAGEAYSDERRDFNGVVQVVANSLCMQVDEFATT